jgi:hypothetical protein
MSAVPSWVEYNGSSPTPTNIGLISFGSVDLPYFILSLYPIRAGYNSYSKYFKIRFTGTFVEVSNLKLWQSESLPPGLSIKLGGTGVTYSTPSIANDGDPDIPTVQPISSNIDGKINNSGDLSTYLRLQLHTTVKADSYKISITL